MVEVATGKKSNMADVCFFKPEVVSAVNWHISMKFGLYFKLRKNVTTLNTKPEVVWSRRGRRLEIVYDVITPPWVARFGRHLGTWFRIARKLLRPDQDRKGKKNFQPPYWKSFFAVFFPNAVWASASGGFRIVSDTLVHELSVLNTPVNFIFTNRVK